MCQDTLGSEWSAQKEDSRCRERRKKVRVYLILSRQNPKLFVIPVIIMVSGATDKATSCALQTQRVTAPRGKPHCGVLDKGKVNQSN